MKKILLKLIYKLLGKIPEDVNDDGKVNSLDLLLVKKYILNNEKESEKNAEINSENVDTHK